MAVTAEELVVKITSDTSSAEAGLRNVGNLLASLLTTATGTGGGLADMGIKTESASAQVALLETKATAAAMAAQNLGTRAEQAAAQAEMFASKADLGGANAEAMGLKAQAAANRAQDFGVRAYAAGGQAEYLGAKAAAAATETDALAASSEQTGGKLAALAATLEIGTTAAAGLATGGLILAAAMGEAAKTAGEWQQSMVLLQNNTGISDQQLVALKGDVLDLSVATGASTESIATGFEHAQNILQDYTAAQAVATAATASAVATGADAGMVTNATAQVMKEYNAVVTNAGSATANYAADLQNANEIQNAFHVATQTSNTRLEELVPATSRAIGQAAALGFSYTDVLAVFSTLSKHGFPDAALAGTQVTDMIVHMAHETPATAKALQELQDKSGDAGVAQAFDSASLNAKGFIGTLDFLKKAMDDAGMSQAEQLTEIYNLIPAMKGGQGAVAALTVGYGDLHTQQSNILQGAKDNTQLQQGLARELATTGGQADVLKENLHELAVTMGGPLNDGLTQVLGGVNTLASGIRALSSAYTDLATHVPAVSAGVKEGLIVMAEGAPIVGPLIETFATLKATHDQLAPAVDHTSAAITTQTADLYNWGQTAVAAASQVTAAIGAQSAGGYDWGQAASDAAGMVDPVGANIAQAVSPAAAQAATTKAALATVTDEQKGIASNIKDEQTAIKDTTALYQAQLDPLDAKLKLENSSFALNSGALKQSIADVTAGYEAQLAPLQQQQERLKLNLEVASGPLNAAADQLKLQYDGQIAPLQAQLDTFKAQYDLATGPLKQSVESITADYNQQIEPTQTTLDHLKTQYDLASGPLKLSVEQITAEYNKQLDPLQAQLDLLKLQNDQAVGPLQISIANITDQFQQQIAPTQTTLDHLNEQYTLASGPLKESIEQITQSFNDQIAPQQHALDLLNQQYTVASDQLNRSIEDVTEKYQAQLDPLNRQLQDLQQANDLTNQQVDLQNQITDARLKQALLVDQGDPVQRAKIAAQLELNKMQEDNLKLVQQQTTLTAQLAAPNLAAANRSDLELQLQDTQLKLQLAGMVDQTGTAQIVQQQALLTVQQQSATLTRTQADDTQKLAEIPLEQQIRQVTQAQKDALTPLQSQLEVLKEQHDYSVQDMTQAINNLKDQEYDRLKPLQDQLANLTLQHDLAVGPLERAILEVKQAETDRLAPMQEQLKTLQLQYNTAVGPLNLAIEGLKAQEAGRLKPMQDQLTQLQLQYNLATGPLQLSIESLKGKEADRLRPIQDQLTQLQLQYNLNTGPLNTSIVNLQNAEKARLTPIQTQLTTLQLQYDLANTTLQPEIDTLTLAEKNRLKPMQDQLKAMQDQHNESVTHIQSDIDAQKQKEQEALKPLQDQLQVYQDMNTQLGDLISKWKDLPGAVAAASTAAGGFHAPGKGPLDGAAAAPLYGNDPNVKATFEGYAAQQHLDPATLWKQQSGNLTAAPYTGGGGGSEDVVALAENFTDTYAYGSGANTYCERFVANIEGRDVQATAYVAAQHRIAANQMHFDMPPPAGAEVYYGPNAGNEYDGHVAIALGNGMQRGVTSSGIKDDSTAMWAANVAPFLGWVPAHTPMYDQGGVVPGAYGQPSLAIVHGGEEYLGLAGQRGTLAGRTAAPVPVVNIYVSGNTMLGRDPQVAQELWRLIEPAARQLSSYGSR